LHALGLRGQRRESRPFAGTLSADLRPLRQQFVATLPLVSRVLVVQLSCLEMQFAAVLHKQIGPRRDPNETRRARPSAK
jgi:hypothetical protein